MADQIPLILVNGTFKQATASDSLVVGGQPLAFKDRSTHSGTQTASTISDQMGFSHLLAFAASRG
jgi:hypothetical protein